MSKRQDEQTIRTDKALPIEVVELLAIYEAVSEFLKGTGNPTLERLAETWDDSLPQIRERLALSTSTAEGRAAIRGLKQGLRDLPKLIKSSDRVGYSQLISKIENSVGIKFSDI